MTREKDRVAALIIKDKKLLLVTGHNEDFFWTPGGRLEEGEDKEKGLARELQEELGIQIISSTFYESIEFININNQLQTSHCYLVDYSGELKPDQEITGYIWASYDELISGAIPVTDAIRSQIIPKLKADNLL